MLSVIVTTYNRPPALALVLAALAAQRQRAFEVLVADDGSGPDTAALLARLQPVLPYPLTHVWQEDCGFRAAAARNRAVAAARGDYLVFLDGDCLARPDFLSRHAALAEPGYFVVGNRVLLSQRASERVLAAQLPLWQWRWPHWLRARLRGEINRLLPLLRLPDGGWRRHRQRWQGARTCNLALWRRDLIRVNGFDEAFQGWGHEDADLVVRLLRAGVRRKDGHYALAVLHLWHPEQSRAQETVNRSRLQAALAASAIRSARGLDQYLH